MRSSSGSSSSSSSSYDSQYFSAIPSPSTRDFTHHDAFFIVSSRDDLCMKSSATEAAPSSSFTYSQCSTLTPSPSTSRDRNTTHGVSINGFRSEDDNRIRPSWSTSIASTSTSQTSSSNPSPSTSHDVFISFRGEDTRCGFVSHLCAAFERHGIRAYMDCDLERGNEIFSTLVVAIKQSKILLIVFSQNYAESTWTLKELTEIMESNNNETQHVIPIFYKVTPTEVRHQRGNYETAFKRHKKQFKADNETVQKWKTAMTKAADLSGWVCSGSSCEAKLVEEISIYIMRKLESMSRGGIVAEDIHNIIAATEPQGATSLLPSQNYSDDPNNSGDSHNLVPPQESFTNHICLPHGRNILGNLRLWRRENERLVLQVGQEPDKPSTSHSPRTIVHSWW